MKGGKIRMNRYRWFLCIIFLLLLVCAHCRRESPEQVISELVDGVTVVKNSGQPVFGDFSFDLREDLVIGGDYTDDNYYFPLRPPDMEVDDQGNIYVVDYSNARIQKYDRSGRYLDSYGRSGQGPGEFQSVNRIQWDGRGILWVFDSTRKIVGFNQDGTLAEVFKVEVPGLFELRLSQEGFIFASTRTINTDAGPRRRIIRIEPGESRQEIIHEFELPASVDRPQRASHYYQNGLTLTSMDGSQFCFGYSAEYRIYRCDRKGKIVLIIENNEAPTPISAKEKAETLEKGIYSWSGSQRPKDLDFPPHHPYFRQILADKQGRIYVERMPSILESDPQWKFDVFGKDGSFLYRVKLPIRPHLINDGSLFVISAEETIRSGKVTRYEILNWARFKAAL
jgi:hypothetical protein